MLINGERQDAVTGETYEIKNPATGEVIDTVPKGSAEDARRAIDAAEAALEEWSATSAEARGKIIFKAMDAMRERMRELCELLTKEQGKPIKESENEIEHFLHGMEFYAGLASKLRGAYVPLPDGSMYGMVLRQPIGVCGAIVPWNFPITLMGTKVGPGLVAGNTLVVKPASTTPLTTLRICELIQQAGLPKGALNVITGPGGVVGEELLENPKVRRVAFTGSTEVGRHVGEVAGRNIKRLTLELGGSDPLIVCDDANLKRALVGASVGRFYNCGQACLAVKRLYVFDTIYDEFMAQLVGRVQRMKVGNGLQPDVRMGPMHLAYQREEVEAQVADALDRGARPLVGPGRPSGDGFERGYFLNPTILENVAQDSRMVREEVFGPALPVWRVKNLDEAIERANDSMFGLGASIFTQDLSKARKAAEKLQAGNVWVNSLHIGFDEMPFGGVKQSGLGREHGPEALDYYLETKGVVIAT